MATGDWEILIRKFVLMERYSELVTFSERVAIGVTIRVVALIVKRSPRVNFCISLSPELS